MIEIKKSSWHYKVWKLWCWEEPKNLCVYFGVVVTKVIFPVALIFLIISNWIVTLMVIIVGILLGIILGKWGDKEISKEGLLESYVKAKKNKICPFLDIKD